MEKNQEDESLSFKHWISRTVAIGIILMMIIYGLEQYIGLSIVTDTVIAITLTLFIGLTHEMAHYVVAIRLGYKPKWYRTKLMMGFEIIPHSNRKKWRIDNKKIASAPYILLIPICIVILIVGWYYWHLGLMVAGGASLLFHLLTVKKEGVIV